jgi:hypothetical protein
MRETVALLQHVPVASLSYWLVAFALVLWQKKKHSIEKQQLLLLLLIKYVT